MILGNALAFLCLNNSLIIFLLTVIQILLNHHIPMVLNRLYNFTSAKKLYLRLKYPKRQKKKIIKDLIFIKKWLNILKRSYTKKRPIINNY